MIMIYYITLKNDIQFLTIVWVKITILSNKQKRNHGILQSSSMTLHLL